MDTQNDGDTNDEKVYTCSLLIGSGHWNSFRGNGTKAVKIYGNINPQRFYAWIHQHTEKALQFIQKMRPEVYKAKFFKQAGGHRYIHEANGDTAVFYCAPPISCSQKQIWMSSDGKKHVTYFNDYPSFRDTAVFDFLRNLNEADVLRKDRASFTNPTEIPGVGWVFDIDDHLGISTRLVHATMFAANVPVDLSVKRYQDYGPAVWHNGCDEAWKAYSTTIKKPEDYESISRSLDTEKDSRLFLYPE